MKMKTIATVLLLIGLTACTQENRQDERGNSEKNVSLVQLIANPSVHDASTITTVGFVHFASENNALFIGETDYRHFITKNSIWVEYPDGMKARLEEFNNKYVIATGRFYADKTGHVGLYSGTLEIKQIRTNDPEKDGESDTFRAFP